MSIGLVPAIAVGVLINKFMNTESILNLLLAIVIYTVVYCVSMWLISMNKFEKGLIIAPVKKILRK